MSLLNAIQLLANGLKNKNWTDIKIAYESLAGESFEEINETQQLENKPKKRGRPKKKVAEEETIPIQPYETNIHRLQAGRVTKEKRPNLFKDDHSLDQLLPKGELQEVLKEAKQKRPPNRKTGRPIVKLVEVTCSICHKREKVSPSLAPPSIEGEISSYRCNKCCKTN